MAIVDNTEMTPKETLAHAWRVEEFEKQAEFQIKLKELDIQFQREAHEGELALKELEAKWRSLLKLPIYILRLPLLPFFGIAYICSMFTKKEMPKRFWDLLS